MSSVNWPVVIGVFVAGGIICSVILAAIVQGIFQTPKKRANIANAYTDTNVKNLQQEWQAEYQKLKKSYNALLKQCEKSDQTFSESQTRLNETRVALRLLNNAAIRSIPILRMINNNDDELAKLTNALDTVRKILDRI